ncbi:cupin domain-containing protein [Psychromarinibacter sp. C21-152]|uniref:Cupin domain-containing protein n=1 Tax=Psychromarinibacter sediminicola TaxID=3033385 RepID=A0AAE3NQE9_9RHOB|nr:cupin domain-containing protein [Psychromarinibacter sediminicola]MDF0602298.1 cupin domain-containing protein [Psychromarinibacter sediminicola]
MQTPNASVIPKRAVPPRIEDDAWARMRFRNLVDARCAPGMGIVQGTARFAPGEGEALHSHPIGETAHVLTGGGTVTLDGAQRSVEPGDTVVAPAGTVHGWQAGPAALEILYTFPADDFDAIEYRYVDP